MLVLEVDTAIGGDFNTLPASELCKFMRQVSALEPRVTTAPWWYQDDVVRESKTETWTVRELVDPSTFASKAKELRALLVSRLELPESLPQLKYELPAAHVGSDHFALGAKFCFSNEVDEVDEEVDDEVEEGVLWDEEEEWLNE
ncbi:hypothetical protein BGZ68_004682 [Mortierella alpina]|nr:hypothetical protein BGZ68_004682 [Mortierella alpina]